MITLVRSGGFRFALAEMVAIAARARRRDASLWPSTLQLESATGPGWLDDSNQREVVTLCTVPCEFSVEWRRIVAATIADGADVVYADHVEADGRPLFKPDYSPDLAAEEYLPFVAVRRSVIEGSSQAGSEISALIRSACQRAKSIVHVSDIHARLLAHQTAVSSTAAAKETRVKLSVIIPTRDNLPLLRACVASLAQGEADPPEVIIVDHGSVEPATLEWLEQQQDASAVTVIRDGGVFNWSRLSNLGAYQASGDVLVFLNNDVEVISADWGGRLASVALKDGVGAVGPLLLYPDGRIQHAGVVVGYGGYADHVYSGATLEEATESCFVPPTVTRNVAAVTGACLATTRSRFAELGGFSEALTVAGDVDFCLRAVRSGYRNVFEPRARLYHFESLSRGPGLPIADRELLRARIAEVLPNGDPWFNRNLSLTSRFPLVDLFS